MKRFSFLTDRFINRQIPSEMENYQNAAANPKSEIRNPKLSLFGFREGSFDFNALDFQDDADGIGAAV